MTSLGFRELNPIDFWSASVNITGIDNKTLDQHLRVTIDTAKQNFLGFEQYDRDQTLLIASRYPRKKYGIPTVEECRTAMVILGQKLGRDVVEQPRLNQPVFRVVLGLVEGYGDNNQLHTLPQVRQALGEEFQILPGMVHSAGYLYGPEYTTYTEPAAIIRGDISILHRVYDLADLFNQERFTVENLHDFQSYVVETRHCRYPDQK